MTDLSFHCVDVVPERLAAGPTLLFRLRIAAPTGTTIHAIALRVQVHLEPKRREYSPQETEMLNYLFGEPSRFGDTIPPLQLTNTSIMVPGFAGSTEVEVPVPCTYDLEVAAGRYLHALEDGAVPMTLRFAGTVRAAHVALTLQAAEDGSDIELNGVSGHISGDDLTINWLRPLPPGRVAIEMDAPLFRPS